MCGLKKAYYLEDEKKEILESMGLNYVFMADGNSWHHQAHASPRSTKKQSRRVRHIIDGSIVDANVGFGIGDTMMSWNKHNGGGLG